MGGSRVEMWRQVKAAVVANLPNGEAIHPGDVPHTTMVREAPVDGFEALMDTNRTERFCCHTVLLKNEHRMGRRVETPTGVGAIGKFLRQPQILLLIQEQAKAGVLAALTTGYLNCDESR